MIITENNNMEEILKNIDDAINDYNDLKLFNCNLQLSEILRKLNSNLFYLERHRLHYYKKWQSVYFQSKGSSDAAKTRESDNQVIELYQLRRLMTSAYKIVDGIRSQIGIYKQENK